MLAETQLAENREPLCYDGACLSRAEQLVQLEQRIDQDEQLGICCNQRPLLDDTSPAVCMHLSCLWSDAVQRPVDMHHRPLQLLPAGDPSRHRCPSPGGGQRPVPAGLQPEVSFIITMHNGGQNTARCLLELFRTAREVESAEYVLVNDGSTEDVSIALEVWWQGVVDREP